MIKELLVLFHICLVTHENELNRLKTNTGQLVLRETSSSYKLSLLIWGGRNDNVLIEQKIKSFTKTPILLWTDSNNNNISLMNDNENDHTNTSNNVYIILDGTFQEAEKIYRKGPIILRQLPKLFLTSSSSSSSSSSSYRLRKNFGFRKKYDINNNDNNDIIRSQSSNLLCTAEVCAEIIRSEGMVADAEKLLDALDKFQQNKQ